MHSISKLAAVNLGEKLSIMTTNTEGVKKKLEKAKATRNTESIKMYELELTKLELGNERLRFKKALY